MSQSRTQKNRRRVLVRQKQRLEYHYLQTMMEPGAGALAEQLADTLERITQQLQVMGVAPDEENPLQGSLFGCQRWVERKDRYRPPGEVIDTSRYEVKPIAQKLGKAFVIEHHYLGTYPASIFQTGLFRAGALVGVAAFSNCSNRFVTNKYLNMEQAVATCLGRFVLVDDVPGNGESWFLARSFKLLRENKPHVRGVVSYSDPTPRIGEDGVTTPGHLGIIYQATNALYQGRSRALKQWVIADSGVALDGRSLSKLRQDDRGGRGMERTLVGLGLPGRLRGEASEDYLERVLRAGQAQGVLSLRPSLQKHVYVFGVTKGDRRYLKRQRPPKPHPKAYDYT